MMLRMMMMMIMMIMLIAVMMIIMLMMLEEFDQFSDSCTGWRDITVILFKNCISSLPDDKNLDNFKLKAFADDKINVTDKLNFVMG